MLPKFLRAGIYTMPEFLELRTSPVAYVAGGLVILGVLAFFVVFR